jgi:hypothetical protein
MQSVTRQCELAVAEEVRVREIGRKHCIVVLNRRAEEQRLLAIDP